MSMWIKCLWIKCFSYYIIKHKYNDMGNSNKIILLTALGLILLAITVVFVVFPFSDNSSSNSLNDNTSGNSSSSNIFLECEQIENGSARQECHRGNALSAVQSGSSIDELHQLAREALGNQHRKEHAIGRAILITSEYNLGAVSRTCESSDCSFGFYHGLTEEFGEYAPLRMEEFKDFVGNFCDFEGPERGNCYHHLGHSYLYMSPDKNFESGLAICNALTDNTDLLWCGYGVIHQYFAESNRGKLSDFFDRCAGYTDRRAGVCYEVGSYRHANRFYKQKDIIEAVIGGCDELSAKIPVEFNRCYEGVARWFLAGKESPPAPELCEMADTSKELCINGLSSSWPDEADQKVY